MRNWLALWWRGLSVAATGWPDRVVDELQTTMTVVATVVAAVVVITWPLLGALAAHVLFGWFASPDGIGTVATLAWIIVVIVPIGLGADAADQEVADDE